MKKTNIKYLITISFMILSSLLINYNPAIAITEEELPHFRFGYATIGVMETWDPVGRVVPSSAWMVANNVEESLMRWNGSEWVPRLALRMEQTSPLTQIYHLRENVTFHDGTPFNASCVKWNIDRHINISGNPTHKYYYGFTQPVDPIRPFKTEEWDIDWIPEGGRYPEVNDTTVINNTAIELRFNIPKYTINDFVIVSPTAYAGYELTNWFHVDTLVGTGPFKYLYYDPFEERIYMERYDNYWDGPAKIKYMECVFFASSDAAQDALYTGELDFMLGAGDIEFTNSSEDFDLVLGSSLAWPDISFITMPIHKYPFFVRKAMSYAFDYDRYIDIETDGIGIRPPGLLNHGNPYLNESIPLPYYNLTIARQAVLDNFTGDPRIADLTTENSEEMNEKWEIISEITPFFNYTFWYLQISLGYASMMDEACKAVGFKLNATLQTDVYLNSFFWDRETHAQLPSIPMNSLLDFGSDPRWGLTYFQSDHLWNLAFIEDADLDVWTWEAYFLGPDTEPTLQEKIDQIVWRVQVEYMPYLLIMQYPMHAAKNAHWVGDSGPDFAYFYNFDYIEEFEEEVVVIPGFPLEYLGLTSIISIIGITYISKRKKISIG